MKYRSGWLASFFVIVGLLSLGSMAQAGILSDDEARQAILQLRTQVDNLEAKVQKNHNEVSQPVSNGFLNLQNQISQLQSSLKTMQGQIDELAYKTSNFQQKTQQDNAALNERLKKLEPATVSVDGVSFQAMPEEKSSFEASLASFRSGDFQGAADKLKAFIVQYGKGSGYYAAALYWQGNALFALNEYTSAIVSLRSFISVAPSDSNVPDAFLTIANCQFSKKQIDAGKKTLANIIDKFPTSAAAANARQQLKQLR